MDTLLSLPALPRPRLLVVTAPHAARPQLLEVAAQLALRGPLRVIDAGNQFNVYPVARSIRRLSHELSAALNNIRLARAFTCYQVLAMLETPPPAAPPPTLVFDLLSTFYDENVAVPESMRLLRQAIDLLLAISRRAPVMVGARPPGRLVTERGKLYELLLAAADECWPPLEAEPLALPPAQLSLFPPTT